MNMNELANLSQDPVELIKQAQHILEVAKEAAENQDNVICCARDYALDLLCALDEKQEHYQPKPNEWIVQRIYDLVSVLDERNGGSK